MGHGGAAGGYLRRAAAAGIDRTVLFPAFHSDYAVANRVVARIVSGRPDRFFGFAFINPERDRGRVADLVREAVGRYGFRGIKVHRYDARITREVCEVAARFLPAPGPLRRHGRGLRSSSCWRPSTPDVTFIIPHLGSFADDWWAQQALIDPLVRHANIYTDTSGIRRFDILAQAVRRAGAGKVLFGSDGPWLHPGLELAKVRALGLSAADERLVLGLNWLRLTSRVRARQARRVAISLRATLASVDKRDHLAGQAPAEASGEHRAEIGLRSRVKTIPALISADLVRRR